MLSVNRHYGAVRKKIPTNKPITNMPSQHISSRPSQLGKPVNNTFQLDNLSTRVSQLDRPICNTLSQLGQPNSNRSSQLTHPISQPCSQESQHIGNSLSQPGQLISLRSSPTDQSISNRVSQKPISNRSSQIESYVKASSNSLKISESGNQPQRLAHTQVQSDRPPSVFKRSESTRPIPNKIIFNGTSGTREITADAKIGPTTVPKSISREKPQPDRIGGSWVGPQDATVAAQAENRQIPQQRSERTKSSGIPIPIQNYNFHASLKGGDRNGGRGNLRLTNSLERGRPFADKVSVRINRERARVGAGKDIITVADKIGTRIPQTGPLAGYGHVTHVQEMDERRIRAIPRIQAPNVARVPLGPKNVVQPQSTAFESSVSHDQRRMPNLIFEKPILRSQPPSQDQRTKAFTRYPDSSSIPTDFELDLYSKRPSSGILDWTSSKSHFLHTEPLYQTPLHAEILDRREPPSVVEYPEIVVTPPLATPDTVGIGMFNPPVEAQLLHPDTPFDPSIPSEWYRLHIKPVNCSEIQQASSILPQPQNCLYPQERHHIGPVSQKGSTADVQQLATKPKMARTVCSSPTDDKSHIQYSLLPAPDVAIAPKVSVIASDPRQSPAVGNLRNAPDTRISLRTQNVSGTTRDQGRTGTQADRASKRLVGASIEGQETLPNSDDPISSVPRSTARAAASVPVVQTGTVHNTGQLRITTRKCA